MPEFSSLQIFLVSAYLNSLISCLHEISISFYGRRAEKVALDFRQRMYLFLISAVSLLSLFWHPVNAVGFVFFFFYVPVVLCQPGDNFLNFLSCV